PESRVRDAHPAEPRLLRLQGLLPSEVPRGASAAVQVPRLQPRVLAPDVPRRLSRPQAILERTVDPLARERPRPAPVRARALVEPALHRAEVSQARAPADVAARQ